MLKRTSNFPAFDGTLIADKDHQHDDGEARQCDDDGEDRCHKEEDRVNNSAFCLFLVDTD